MSLESHFSKKSEATYQNPSHNSKYLPSSELAIKAVISNQSFGRRTMGVGLNSAYNWNAGTSDHNVSATCAYFSFENTGRILSSINDSKNITESRM